MDYHVSYLPPLFKCRDSLSSLVVWALVPALFSLCQSGADSRGRTDQESPFTRADEVSLGMRRGEIKPGITSGKVLPRLTFLSSAHYFINQKGGEPPTL